VFLALFVFKYADGFTGSGTGFNITQVVAVYTTGFERLKNSDNGTILILVFIVVPLGILSLVLKSFRINVKVYTDRVDGTASFGLKQRRFSISYNQILNVDIEKNGIIIITQYEKYRCAIGNINEIRQSILGQKAKLGM